MREYDGLSNRIPSQGIQAIFCSKIGTEIPVRDIQAISRMSRTKMETEIPGRGIQVISRTNMGTEIHGRSIQSLPCTEMKVGACQ